MNAEWSEKNKRMQQLLRASTFQGGIAELLALRSLLKQEMDSWKGILSPEDYSAIPFLFAEGYHSKTVAYSIWHIIRIEDIVVNTLVRRSDEVLFSQRHLQKIHAPAITTGNELVRQEIALFSRQLDIDALYDYCEAVKASSEEWLKTLAYADLKTRFTQEDQDRIRRKNVVSQDESAAWLIGYWCQKDIGGLLKMPLSRHWIMHVEAANRIIRKLQS